MTDRFPISPIRTFGSGFETSRPPEQKPHKAKPMFWLALAGCCLGPLGYSAFVLFLLIRH